MTIPNVHSIAAPTMHFNEVFWPEEPTPYVVLLKHAVGARIETLPARPVPLLAMLDGALRFLRFSRGVGSLDFIEVYCAGVLVQRWDFEDLLMSELHHVIGRHLGAALHSAGRQAIEGDVQSVLGARLVQLQWHSPAEGGDPHSAELHVYIRGTGPEPLRRLVVSLR